VTHFFRVRLRLGVRIGEDLVPVFATGQHVGRHVVRLAGEIHQRHFDAGHPAALSAGSTELTDLAEQPLDIARVFTQQSTLQHENE
jgi:hypothetical protein